MTMPEVSCTAVAIQNSSQWPCSTCPIPQLRLVGVRTSYIYFSLIFPGHSEFWTLFQIPICPPHWLHPVTVTVLIMKIPQMPPPLGTEIVASMANVTNAGLCCYDWKLGGAAALLLT